MAKKPSHLSETKGGKAAYGQKRLQLIGQVILDWNVCEQMLELILWLLIGVDHTMGECITTDLNNTTRQTMAENLLKRFHGESPHFTRFMMILALYDECRQARNSATHSRIVAGPDDFTAISVTMKAKTGKLRGRLAHVDILEFEVTAAAIGWLLTELLSFQDALKGGPFPSHDKDLLPVYVELLEQLRRSRQSHDFPLQPSPE